MGLCSASGGGSAVTCEMPACPGAGVGLRLPLPMKALAILLTFLCAAGVYAASLEEEIEQIRAKHGLPSLAVYAQVGEGAPVSIATGVRKLGAPERVTTQDVWHIGSCTKSMTATLAALYVAQGKLKWTTTVGEIFPEWHGAMPAEWKGVTLEQLLMHRSGAPGDAPPDLWAIASRRAEAPMNDRLNFVHGLVTRPPAAPPGTKYIYSNQGYAIAGAMVERVAKRPWEQLMREQIFGPLEMKSAGFGVPASPGQVDQPWGHAGDGDKATPVAPGPEADNPPVIGPAGTVHCSLADLAKYCAIHELGEEKGWKGLKPQDFVKLHTPAPDGDYAMGWGVARRDWAGGVALNHSGSNKMFFTDIWIAPAKKAVFISATNIGGDPAAAACDEAVAAAIRRFLSS